MRRTPRCPPARARGRRRSGSAPGPAASRPRAAATRPRPPSTTRTHRTPCGRSASAACVWRGSWVPEANATALRKSLARRLTAAIAVMLVATLVLPALPSTATAQSPERSPADRRPGGAHRARPSGAAGRAAGARRHRGARDRRAGQRRSGELGRITGERDARGAGDAGRAGPCRERHQDAHQPGSCCSWSTGGAGPSTPRSATCPPGLWPGHENVTLRELLSHAGGMPDYLDAFIARTRTVRQFERMLSQRRTDRELVRAAQQEKWQFRTRDVLGLLEHQLRHRRVDGGEGDREVAVPPHGAADLPAGRNDGEHARQDIEGSGHLAGGDRPCSAEKLRDFSDTDPSLFSAAGALVTTTSRPGPVPDCNVGGAAGVAVTAARDAGQPWRRSRAGSATGSAATGCPTVPEGPVRLRSRRRHLRHADHDVLPAQGGHEGWRWR